jgi:hypothetical protein
MQTRRRLWHLWRTQLRSLVPAVRATRVTNLALLTLGLLLAGTVSLPAVAAAIPLATRDPSRERRLRRWLANPAITVQALWTPLLPTLLAGKAGQDLRLIFDPTPYTPRLKTGAASILVVSLVHHKRSLPLAWRVLPQQQAWPAPQITYLRAMLTEIKAALPPSCTVTLLADRGITGPEVIDLCRELDWHFVLRVSVSPAQTNRVQVPDQPEGRLWELVPGPGQRWTGTVQLFKAEGWRTVNLTIRWDRDAHEPWVLVSDQPAGMARVRDYRCRMRAEATYQDGKSRGFQLNRSKLTDHARLDRLLLALHLAIWWSDQLGLRVIRRGQRRLFDRSDRRDLSVLRLARRAMAEALLHDRCPHLPFRWDGTAWQFTWFT